MMGKGAILGSILVAVLSWVCLGFLVNYTSPGTLTQPVFLLLLFVALMATFIPVASYFNRRFVSSEDDEDSDLISSKSSARAARQSGSAALFLVLCAWLRMIRFLTWPIALLLLVALVSIEILMLTRH